MEPQGWTEKELDHAYSDAIGVWNDMAWFES